MLGDAFAAEAAAALGTAAYRFAPFVIPAALLNGGAGHSVSAGRPAARTVRKPPMRPRIPLATASNSRNAAGKASTANESLIARFGLPLAPARIPACIPTKAGRI